jgi:hypothetical protein
MNVGDKVQSTTHGSTGVVELVFVDGKGKLKTVIRWDDRTTSTYTGTSGLKRIS